MGIHDVSLTDRQTLETKAEEVREDVTSAMADFEAAASAALSKAETFARENPLVVALGVGAAGALLAMALTSRKAQATTIDRRVLDEINKHSEDLVRAVRRNANAIAGSNTMGTIENLASAVVTQLVKMPDLLSKQMTNLTK